MDGLMLENEAAIRLGVFLGTLFVLAFLERWAPRLVLSTPRPARWFANLGIVAVDTLTVRFLLPVLPVGFALLCSQEGWGLLNSFQVPYGVAVIAGVVLFDFFIYVQHVLFHHMPTLWRLHGVHHTDLDFDVTTAVRFHPGEIVLSMGIKLGLVYLFGPPALSVILFEIILCSTAMFSHSNLRLPLRLDAALRLLIVTPDMHRVHHSVIIREHNSNFGFNLSVWDRLLGTYRPQPEKGHEGMAIGLANFRDPSRLNLLHILALPFTYRHP
jgi:sterol desaturase/sphingolipid hydroxylase (fatty acid hydroxylase superfamily)